MSWKSVIVLAVAILAGLVLVDCKKNVTVSCTSSPKSVKMLTQKSFVAVCPANCAGGALWGTDFYTTDSSICMAGIHAGVIKKEIGGNVTVTIEPGQPKYTGSERNGITSNNWPSYDSSFKVAK